MQYLGKYLSCHNFVEEGQYYLIFSHSPMNNEVSYIGIGKADVTGKYYEKDGLSLRSVDEKLKFQPTVGINGELHLNFCPEDDIFKLTDIEVSVALLGLI